MIDPVLKKAMGRRDEALREAERWEAWIKEYVELCDQTADSLDIPMTPSASSRTKQPDDVTKAERVVAASVESEENNHSLAPNLQTPASAPAETDNKNGRWTFRGKAKSSTDYGLDSVPTLLAEKSS